MVLLVGPRVGSTVVVVEGGGEEVALTADRRAGDDGGWRMTSRTLFDGHGSAVPRKRSVVDFCLSRLTGPGLMGNMSGRLYHGSGGLSDEAHGQNAADQTSWYKVDSIQD